MEEMTTGSAFPVSAKQVTEFLDYAQSKVTKHRLETYPTLGPVTLSLEPGKRYIRVVREDGGSRGVFCFIDTTNGDILKAASWKAPAKHARGSVHHPVTWSTALTVYGAARLCR